MYLSTSISRTRYRKFPWGQICVAVVDRWSVQQQAALGQNRRKVLESEVAAVRLFAEEMRRDSEGGVHPASTCVAPIKPSGLHIPHVTQVQQLTARAQGKHPARSTVNLSLKQITYYLPKNKMCLVGLLS